MFQTRNKFPVCNINSANHKIHWIWVFEESSVTASTTFLYAPLSPACEPWWYSVCSLSPPSFWTLWIILTLFYLKMFGNLPIRKFANQKICQSESFWFLGIWYLCFSFFLFFFFFLFLMWTIFKVLIEFVTILPLFYVLVFFGPVRPVVS